MERLKVINFLTVESADIEVRKINLFIGKQAQGKSVVAKLLYFFKNSFGEQYSESIQDLSNKREFDKALAVRFEQIFPRYTWDGTEFSVVYEWEDFEILVQSPSGKSSQLRVTYCQKLIDIFRRLKSSYKIALEQLDEDISKKSTHRAVRDRDSVYWEVVGDKLFSDKFFPFNRSIFVPASRSFFANLQKNVFSFLASNIDIDPLIKNFGSRYENSKRLYSNSYWINRQDEKYRRKVEALVRDIAVGDYEYKDEKDWIRNGSKSVNLANASSGQQESIPMLLILSIWPSVFSESTASFFIEEPEAHLFPIAQKSIISLISTIMGTYGHQFFITTHSPYVLTAINNLILAGDAFAAVDPGSKAEKKLDKIVDRVESIAFEDVAAYTIQDGRFIDISDAELRLLGSSVLDEVSDSFERVFDALSESLYKR